jgi:hypothetical protein
MSESVEGVSRKVTRQNAGSVLNGALAFALVAPAGTNAPAGMDSEDSTRPPGRWFATALRTRAALAC